MRPIASPVLMRFALAFALACLPALAAAQTRALAYVGVNLAGAEFASDKKPGVLFQDYTYPSDGDFRYFADRGMNVIRLPFLWERLQPALGGALDGAQLAQLRTAVTRARDHGQVLILDPHNYAAFNDQTIGSQAVPDSAFADLWRQLALAFGNDEKVIFGLMNEPVGLEATRWARTAQTAIDAIRATGANNLILVPGVAWTGAHSWTSAEAGGGVSNADALVGLRDPANNLAYEVHQYLDSDSSGTSPTCVSPTIGAEKLEAFTDWLRANGKRGFLGEFGAAANATCLAALDGMLGYIQDNAEVWLGWTYWAGGAWWGDYMFSVQPNDDGSAKPQMAILSDRARQALDAAVAARLSIGKSQTAKAQPVEIKVKAKR
ncbi:glycoside hydrolase family 5 protein [Pseudoxanthomonas winnipegensis]|uniref:Endoglucanase n=2 Tax=Pseudoxanthomonas TaxID=83618 RepID=A0A4Q8M6W5_9GAMM|nr:glycoside hydrolase family 5 protein [Pseudoxanthomonas winnipegensis]